MQLREATLRALFTSKAKINVFWIFFSNGEVQKKNCGVTKNFSKVKTAVKEHVYTHDYVSKARLLKKLLAMLPCNFLYTLSEV